MSDPDSGPKSKPSEYINRRHPDAICYEIIFTVEPGQYVSRLAPLWKAIEVILRELFFLSFFHQVIRYFFISFFIFLSLRRKRSDAPRPFRLNPPSSGSIIHYFPDRVFLYNCSFSETNCGEQCYVSVSPLASRCGISPGK